MEKKIVSTPYDDVFHTLLNDCTNLMIPVVNEIFGESYTGEEPIEFLQNEHFVNLRGKDTKEKITDTCFRIKGKTEKKYHVECQSTADSSMVLRMFEYDSQVALDDAELQKGKLTVTFPHSAVLYLRHSSRTPDALTVEIKTPGGNISYDVPVMKAQTYTINEIFDKNLLFLLPFYIFNYERRFREYDTDKEKLEELRAEYQDIMERLEKLCVEGKITEYTKCTLIDMSRKVVENLASKYANVEKGVISIMGGKILEYEAKTILNDGIRIGRQEGERLGKIEGERLGKIEGKTEAYADMIRDGILSISEAAKRLGLSEKELEKQL